jgi:hypothetical protein
MSNAMSSTDLRADKVQGAARFTRRIGSKFVNAVTEASHA